MPDFETIIDAFKAATGWIDAPPWVFPMGGYILLSVLALLAVWALLLLLSKIKKLIAEEFWPLFYNQDEKRRNTHRRRFAEHIESEIRRLNNLEVWHDYRFTELEAEVEAEGKRRVLGILPFRPRTRSGLRRERSLSKALESSQERLILLEGEPGSGKSVALRHTAQSMARHASRARSTRSVIPIYVNLKELDRRGGDAIDRNLIHSFVLRSLNRVNDRDIEELLEEEFDRGLREGTWLFLFDSFDEIPEVLSSTEADAMIRSYADAISDFSHGMNQCRSVIASRQFRGPGKLRWPRFRILPLSEGRRQGLVAKANLNPELEREIVGRLEVAGHDIRSMASNPMFLGLLCEHIRLGKPFPENVHDVFETYVETRFTRDEDRLWRRFELEPAEVRVAAERIAFCMAADPGLGLSPSRLKLEDATVGLGLELGERFSILLDALEYIKLARSETATAPGESKPFTFAHRRFQEYFATCIVLREPDRVSARQLLTDARWRETAVVMCQTQPIEVLSLIVEEARRCLAEMIDGVPGLVDDPVQYVREYLSKDGQWRSEEGLPPQTFSWPNLLGFILRKIFGEERLPIQRFSWPSGAFHVLGLLQDGFGGRVRELPDDVRVSAARLVVSGSTLGILFDRKRGLEVAGILPQPVLLGLLRNAFASPSQLLKEVAYRQVARLEEIPDDIAQSMRRALVGLYTGRQLRRERHATYAHLARLDNSVHFVSVARLLLWARNFDIGLLVSAFLVFLTESVWMTPSTHPPGTFRTLVIVAVLLLLSVSLRARKTLVFVRIISGIALVGSIVTRQLTVSGASFATFLYALSWMPFAIFCGKEGLLTHPLCWPIIPLLSLHASAVKSTMRDVKSIKRGAKYLLDELREGRIRNLLWRLLLSALEITLRLTLLAVGMLVIIVFMIGGLEGLAPFVLAWVILGVLLGVLGFIAVCRDGRDWCRWYGWLWSHKVPITERQFLESISQYHADAIRVRLIRTVRQQGLLVVTDETEGILENLLLAIERTRRRDNWIVKATKKQRGSTTDDLDSKEQILGDLSRSDDFGRWYQHYLETEGRKLGTWGSEVVDEIGRLLEQAHDTRRYE